MANIRMAVTNAALSPFTIPGTTRRYTCAAGAVIDVPDFDAAVLASIGWVAMTPKDGSVGPTSGRPAAPHIGQQFIDTTVGAIVVSDGRSAWLHHITGVPS